MSSVLAANQVAVQAGNCLGDAQATNIVDALMDILIEPDRTKVGSMAEELIAEEFMEMSGSVNSLTGQDVSLLHGDGGVLLTL